MALHLGAWLILKIAQQISLPMMQLIFVITAMLLLEPGEILQQKDVWRYVLTILAILLQ